MEAEEDLQEDESVFDKKTGDDGPSSILAILYTRPQCAVVGVGVLLHVGQVCGSADRYWRPKLDVGPQDWKRSSGEGGGTRAMSWMVCVWVEVEGDP